VGIEAVFRRTVVQRPSGEVGVGRPEAESEVIASLTDDETRDADVRSARFMDAEHFPTMTFTSTGVATSTGIGRMYAFLIEGDLTIKGVTRSVVVQATTPQFGLIPERGMSMGISGHTLIHRSEFGVDLNPGIPGGGFLVSDDVEVTLEVEATLEP
jgi:polyisoprenoid-binding protein YceI